MENKKTKKLEINYINDIISMNNEILSQNTNHYLKRLLYDLRLLFRHNKDNLEEFIELYYYIMDMLENNVDLNNDELKIFIYRLTDLSLNIDDYNLNCDTIILESVSYLIQALYQELEAFKIADKIYENEEIKDRLIFQLKNQEIIFKNLIEIKNKSKDEEIGEIVEKLLDNNFYNEYTTYKGRINYLDVI